MARAYTNFARSSLASGLAPADTLITVAAGEGALFPAAGAGTTFDCVVYNTSAQREVVSCTSRTGDVLTVARAQQGTTALTWNAADLVSHRLTAAALNSIQFADNAQQNTATWCGTAGGTANALTLTPTPAVTAMVAGHKFIFKVGAASNTTTATMAISGLATFALQNNGSALVAGDLEANKWYEVLYDGTAGQLLKLQVIVLGTGVATFLGVPTSANLKAAVTDETGSGALVFATSPTLVTPALGTPASGTLTNCTGLPATSIVAGTAGINISGNAATATSATTAGTASAVAVGNVTGLGTGVASYLAVAPDNAGSFVVNGQGLGTPTSGNLTKCKVMVSAALGTGGALTSADLNKVLIGSTPGENYTLPALTSGTDGFRVTFTGNQAPSASYWTVTAGGSDGIFLPAGVVTSFNIYGGQSITLVGSYSSARWYAEGVSLGKVTSGTKQNASGTAVDFTSIPAGTKRIIISINEISTNGTSHPIVQIGDSGGIETSGYTGAVAKAANGSGIASATYAAGLAIGVSTWDAAFTSSGHAILTLLDSATNTWAMSSTLNASTTLFMATSSKALSGELDRVRITTDGGSDTFDAGMINILYEQ